MTEDIMPQVAWGANRTVIVTRCRKSRAIAVAASLTDAEEVNLSAILDQLIEMGHVASYDIAPSPTQTGNFTDTLGLVRDFVGPIPFEIALGAARYSATPTPKPAWLIPVWEFEPHPHHTDTLQALGIFLGSPIAFYAHPVWDHEPAFQLPDFVDWLEKLRAACGDEHVSGTISLGRSPQAYALFAALRPN